MDVGAIGILEEKQALGKNIVFEIPGKKTKWKWLLIGVWP